MNHTILLKRSFVLFLSLFGLVTSAVAETTAEKRARLSRELSKHYYAAETAYKNGELEKARASLRKVFAISPKNSHGIVLQRKIQMHGEEMVLKRKEREFNAVMLKVVDMTEVPLKQAIKLLESSIEANTDGKVVQNFVIQDPHQVFGKEKITLKAKNISVGAVFKHILLQSKANKTFGKYALVIKPDVSLLERAKVTQPSNQSAPKTPKTEIPNGAPIGN